MNLFRRPLVLGLVVFLAYFLLIIALSWPLLPNLDTLTIGLSGDPDYDLWLFDNVVRQDLTVNAPYGTIVPHHIVTPPYPLLDLWSQLTSHVFESPVVRYNLLVLLSFPLTGLAVFYLSRRIALNNLAAFLSGLLYSFSYYHLMKAQIHVNLVGLFWLPFFILSAMRFWTHAGLWRGAVAGALLALTVVDHYQYGLLAAVFLLLLALLYRSSSSSQNRLPGLFAGGVVFLGVLWLIAPWVFSLLAGDGTAFDRGFEYAELSRYSARPFYFMVPPPQSLFFGEWSGPLYETLVARVNNTLHESMLYTGVSTLVLAVLGFWWVVRGKIMDADRRVVLLVAAFGLVAIVLSVAPYLPLGPIKIYTPAHYIFEVFPYFRVWSRFAIGLILAVALLAPIALLLIKQRSRTLFVACAILLFIELMPRSLPTRDVSTTAAPRIYDLLEQNEQCVLADYPLLPADDPVGQRYLGYQRAHRCPLIYGAPVNSSWEKERLALVDATRLETQETLVGRGVRYIVVHTEMYADDQQVKKYPTEYNNGVPPDISNNSLFRLLSCEAGHCIYELK